MISTILNQPKNNHNPERSLKEDCFHELRIRNSQLMRNENIQVDCYDRCNSGSDRSSFNIETENVSRNLDPSDSVKMDLCCNSFKKYMVCMKSIEEPFLTTRLKSIISNTDICTILNEKEN